MATYFCARRAFWHDATLKRVKALFTWRGLTTFVTHCVKICTTGQASKAESIASLGLLHLLTIPSEVWTDIPMDFISGLPRADNKDVIFVVVDRLSKYSHFMELFHPYSVVEVVHVYPDNVYKLHGWPRSIVTRDLFLGKF